MKKLFVYILAVIMMLSVISACGKTGESADKAENAGMENRPESAVNTNTERDVSLASAVTADSDYSGDADTDADGESYTPPNEYFMSPGYYDNVQNTYIQKDYKTENRLMKAPEPDYGSSLSIYKVVESADTDFMRGEVERFLDCFGVKGDSVTYNMSDDCCIALTAAKKENTLPGTPAGSFDGKMVTITANGVNLMVEYTPKDGVADKGADTEFIQNFTKTDSVARAVCAYAGINSAEISYAAEYNIYGEKSASYRIYDAAKSGENPEGTVSLEFSPGKSMLFFIALPGAYVEKSACPVRTREEAVDTFCTENGIDQNDILETGFGYMERYYNTFLPCYLILLPGDNEFSKISGVDLSVYQEYVLLAIPAIDIS